MRKKGPFREERPFFCGQPRVRFSLPEHPGAIAATMIAPRPLLACLVLAALSGCIARTAASVVTAPVRVVSGGVDMVTTSQSESDEKRGRAMRQREERLGAMQRRYERSNARCLRGDERACVDARNEYAEMQNLRVSD